MGCGDLTFFALRLVPVDPAFAILGAGQQQVDISPEVLAVVRQEYHLDEPLIVQYFLYLGRLLRGDLGMSYVQEQPVAPLLAAQAGPTIALALAAIVLAVVISLAGGVLTAGRRLPSWISSGVELVLASTPVFWLGFVLMLVFAVWLRALPILDSGDLRSLVLPPSPSRCRRPPCCCRCCGSRSTMRSSSPSSSRPVRAVSGRSP